ncbi:hypothetical protein [Geothrix fuzhouensis]|uniref:hypothetical protein n=1 Tax=Geothrix fuzhouensis TaxID=2966451 RepID=UPI002148CBED|nr:hypothetical protein [Geothrix fuzhouensis]
MNWFKRLFGNPTPAAETVGSLNEELRQVRESIKSAGSTDGVHYTDTVETIKQLKRESRNEEAIVLLIQSIEATERESRFAGEGWGVAPWYYEQLAIIYRKDKRYEDEVAILERYEAQPKAPGSGPAKLKERLSAAKKLARSHKA